MDSDTEEEDLCFMRNLTSKWRRPEMKNMTAIITMIKIIAGLILLPEEDCFW